MILFRYASITLISLSLVACGGDSDVKAPELTEQEIKDIKALEAKETGDSSLNKPQLKMDEYALYSNNYMGDEFGSVDLEFDQSFDNEVMRSTSSGSPIIYQFEYSWNLFTTTDSDPRTTRITITSLDDAASQLTKALAKKDATDPDSVIRKYVLSNLALAIVFNGNERVASYDELMTKDQINNPQNQDGPYCTYQDNNPQTTGRSDYSMSCNLPDSIIDREVTIRWNQLGKKVFRTTDNQRYEVIEFEQVVSMDLEDLTASTILYRPGLGIISIVPSGIGGDNFAISDSEWTWAAEDANIPL
ncbi:hypothetical protein JCM19231_1476 [Vibrio ishigakensis]|uniref:Lipoprotein n=1 Tax=Vibrio ishigakensis TaxID=1481914 RepID=A0A0B8NYL7_9VIBR|nr:hypothetical protein [Vibrio ishigakensis]GAM59630.1 hypothetical protein JCM19231_1476 [Vibrio ishigakensis]